MELAMKQFDHQERALLEEKKKLQKRMASQNKEQQKLIEEISELEKKLAKEKKHMPPETPKLQNLGQEKSNLQRDQTAVEVKGLWAAAPEPSGQTLSKEVSLHDPKPAISGSKPFRFVFHEGQVFPIEDNRLIGIMQKELKKSRPHRQQSQGTQREESGCSLQERTGRR